VVRVPLKFDIVKYRSKFQDAVVELWRKCNLMMPQNDPVEDIQKKVDFQPNLFFVGLLGDEVIGSVMVGYEGHRGWINYLAVLPGYQKSGYGRKLVEKAIAKSKSFFCLIRLFNQVINWLGQDSSLGMSRRSRSYLRSPC
jgi:ribosomal protein S18 acetylase RimI-like enzyme